jgi:lysine biosynthesis protein LysW
MDEQNNDEVINPIDNNPKQTVCPDCGSPLNIPDDVEVGDVIVCDNEECGVELEVVNTDPVEVDYLMIQK